MILSKPSFLLRSTRPDADRLTGRALGALVVGAVLLLALVLGFLAREAAPVLTLHGLSRFVASDGWFPLEQRLGLLPMVWATLAAALGALLLAAPLGLGVAVFVCFYAGAATARALRLMLALLAGIPSVVFGLWGLTVLVPLIARWQPPGASLLAAMLILALMVVPTVALTGASALTAVPQPLLRGTAALGLSQTGAILGVVLPAARPGIVGGMVLAAARALGETMAVLMVAGNVVQTPGSVFDPVRVLTANIALEMAYATGEHRAALFASGLLLGMLVLALAAAAARTTRGSTHALK
ncbi:phosphate ABC transporter permease subunit PstC [Methylibium sp.]|uniref:phosphate ABC transporter permease subunit PstC n=1 Tax=Methylibium sp. TaxID=2067992 RepID=UPI003D0FDC78